MNKYFVACDLDGTLLPKSKKIKFLSKLFIRRFVKKGNYFAICTGRPYASSSKFLQSLKVDMPLISDNGASIYLPKEDRFILFPIKLDVFKDFLEKVNDYIICAISTSTEKVIFQNKKDIPSWIIHYLPTTTLVEDTLLNALDKDPLLPNIWVKDENIKEFFEILDSYKNEINYRYWGFWENRHSFELFSPNASKGAAMNYLANYFNCNITVAFGDELNDLPMLESANYGVCMINGNKKVLEKTKYHTYKDNEHNGVIDYLKKNKLY